MTILKPTKYARDLFVILFISGLLSGMTGCSGPEEETRVTVAVLPFEDLSKEKGLAYFCEGVAEEILHKLRRVKELRVTDRHSSFLFNGWEYDVSGIGEELEVTYILKGRVDLDDKNLTISAQLIEAARNRRVWAGSFKGMLNDLFTLQNDVLFEVLDALAAEAKIGISEINADHNTENIDALINYALGRYYWLNGKAGSIVKSVEHLRAAVKADTAYALAYATLADAYAVMGYMGVVEPKVAFESCGIAAKKAVTLNVNLSEAHAALGWKYFLYDWNWPEAEKEIRLAINLSPDDATARYRYASFLLAMGRLEEAKAQVTAARKSNPLQPLLRLTMGKINLAGGDYKKAKKIIEEVVEKEPALLLGYIYLVQAYWALGENDKALRLLAEGSEMAGTSELSLSLLGHAWGKVQGEKNALGIIDELAARSEKVYVSSWNQAVVFLGIGDKDKAIDYLRQAVVEKSPKVCYLNVMPMWNDLREDPRFEEILTTIGLKP